MLTIDGRPHDLGGGFQVQRILPFAKKRMVGPFIFLDHMGPVTIAPHQNTDVRPHPHIGLSTLTYLFEGRIVHRDSSGSTATIEPGGVNWMTAGRGISHSERAHEDDRAKTRVLHGLQFWVALPDGAEETAPTFQHYELSQIPQVKTATHTMNLVAGEGFGAKSPVKVTSPLLFADFRAHAETAIKEKFDAFELGVYVVDGEIEIAGQTLSKNHMGIVEKGETLEVKAKSGAHFVVLGGEPFATPRHIWWNLVSSSRERIEEAKKQWKDGTFPMVPGETEFIPLPEN